jgi:hypothetical protein
MSHSPSSGSGPAAGACGSGGACWGPHLPLFFLFLGVENLPRGGDHVRNLVKPPLEPLGVNIRGIGRDGVVQEVLCRGVAHARIHERHGAANHGVMVAAGEADQIFTPAVPAPCAVSGFEPLLGPGFAGDAVTESLGQHLRRPFDELAGFLLVDVGQVAARDFS